MLSIKSLISAKTASDYFKDNYYTQENSLEPPGQWWGEGAKALGLSGQVDKVTFESLLEGHLPQGQKIGIQRDGQWLHRTGWDLTFSAPKSVSVLALVGNDQRLIELHHQAVNATLAEIEKTAAQARFFKNGEVGYEHTHNLAVAQFQHVTSRENDPQLHTHSVILNITQRSDGQFRSLASERGRPQEGAAVRGFLETVYANKRLWGATYRAHLAYGVTQAGYEIERTHRDGRFEIVGVGQYVMAHFSKRRGQIEERLQGQGVGGSHAADQAALATRANKTIPATVELQQSWQKEAESLGFSPVDFIGQVSQATKTPLSSVQQKIEATAAVQRAIVQLSEREAVFSHQELLMASISHALGSVPPAMVEGAVHQAIQTNALQAHTLFEGSTRIPAWTTQAAINLEKNIIRQFECAKNSVSPLSTSILTHQEKSLTSEQQGAVNLVASTTDRIMGIQGYAGTGKTTLLSNVKQLALQRGFHTLGLAPSATAARHLEHDTGIPTYTVHRFLVDKQLQSSLNQKTLVIVDESSMVANREMHDLLSLSETTRARLLLVGDKQQLPAVGSGKPFALLQEAGLTLAIMKTLQRQRNPILREAVNALIQGDIPKAMQQLESSITEIPDKAQRLNHLIEHYQHKTPQQRANTLLLAPTNEDRHYINQRIRVAFQQQGELAVQQIDNTVLLSLNLTRAESLHASFYKKGTVVRFGETDQNAGIHKGEYLTVSDVHREKQALTLQRSNGKSMHWSLQQATTRIEVYEPQARQVSVGEQIRWTRNDAKLGICNGDTGIVTQAKRHKMTVMMSNGRTLQWDTREFQNQHWEYNYAKTVHDAQGKTADAVLAVLNSHSLLSHAKLFYTLVSRARDEVSLVVDDKKNLVEALLQQTGEKTSALMVDGLRERTIDRKLEKAVDSFALKGENPQKINRNKFAHSKQHAFSEKMASVQDIGIDL